MKKLILFPIIPIILVSCIALLILEISNRPHIEKRSYEDGYHQGQLDAIKRIKPLAIEVKQRLQDCQNKNN